MSENKGLAGIGNGDVFEFVVIWYTNPKFHRFPVELKIRDLDFFFKSIIETIDQQTKRNGVRNAIDSLAKPHNKSWTECVWNLIESRIIYCSHTNFHILCLISSVVVIMRMHLIDDLPKDFVFRCSIFQSFHNIWVPRLFRNNNTYYAQK